MTTTADQTAPADEPPDYSFDQSKLGANMLAQDIIMTYLAENPRIVEGGPLALAYGAVYAMEASGLIRIEAMQ